jgi:hypothetical protein
MGPLSSLKVFPLPTDAETVMRPRHVVTVRSNPTGSTLKELHVHTRSLPSTRTRQMLAAIVAFALVSVFVIRTSDAAFNATADNTGNEFSTGTISLDANHEVPMFGPAPALTDATGLKPGDVVEECILITYTDTLQTRNLDEVTLSTAIESPGGLAPQLDVELAVTADCGPVADADYRAPVALPALPTETGWTPGASGEARGFHFRVTVADSAPEGATASGIDFTWSVSTTS